MKIKDYKKILGIISGAITIATMMVPLFIYKDFKDFTDTAQSIGYVGYFFANYLGFGVYLLPLLVKTFNPILLIVIGGFGLAIDEFFAWYAGHVSEEFKYPKRFQRFHHKIYLFVERYGLLATFILGVPPLPGPVYAISGFAAGHFKIPFYKFFLVNFSSRIIRTAIIVVILLKVM